MSYRGALRYNESHRDILVRRFWLYVANGQSPNDCWIWQGKVSRRYGSVTLYVDGWVVSLYAHRASWILHKGAIPSGFNVCHHCDVTLCVNPSHLFLGTQIDNVRDSINKGRHVNPATLAGSRHHKAKLNEEKVIAARKLYTGGVPIKQLAAMYGLSDSNMRAAVNRQSWKHVTNEVDQ